MPPVMPFELNTQSSQNTLHTLINSENNPSGPIETFTEKRSVLQKLSRFCRSNYVQGSVVIAVTVSLIVVGLVLNPAALGFLLFGFLLMFSIATRIFDKPINFNILSFFRPQN